MVSYTEAGRRNSMDKEREVKDDGRYIIFYIFEGEGSGDSAS
jgi:hypothetical protein